MTKSYLIPRALVALALSPAIMHAAPVAAATTWNVTNALSGTSGGPPSNYTINAPWSIVTRSGPDCNQGNATILTVNFSNGYPQFKGKSSNNNDYRPNVVKKFAASGLLAYAGGQQINVGTNRIVMDPGVNECAILRFTVPSSGSYWANANFLGAFVKQGSSPSVNWAGGTGPTDGVDGMIRIKGALYGSKVTTAAISNGQPKWAWTTPPTAMSLNVGDTIDFAVWSRGAYNYDLTILQGWVQKY